MSSVLLNAFSTALDVDVGSITWGNGRVLAVIGVGAIMNREHQRYYSTVTESGMAQSAGRSLRIVSCSEAPQEC